MRKRPEKRTAKEERLDVNLKKYSTNAREHEPVACLTDLPLDYQKALLSVGVTPDEVKRSGSFLQVDQSVVYAQSKQRGIEVMGINDALKKHKWLKKDYWWKAVKSDADKYTSGVTGKQTRGYFLRALPGVKTSFPLQSCLFLDKEGLNQRVHNVIIAEKGSELNIVTGCAVASRVNSGLHLGISEFYVKPGAKITFTMIHNWAEGMDVRPRSACMIEKNGVFISNYIILRPVKSLQMYPTAWCKGENSIARFSTIAYAKKDSYIDIGSRVYLQAKNARAEIISRSIAQDRAQVIARGHLIGGVPNTKAHLECQGLLLSDKARIHAIPELEGLVENTDLSHEAAIGKIAQDKVNYLMSRGLDESTARSVLIRGFLKIDLPGLPAQLKSEIDKAIKQAAFGL